LGRETRRDSQLEQGQGRRGIWVRVEQRKGERIQYARTLVTKESGRGPVCAGKGKWEGGRGPVCADAWGKGSNMRRRLKVGEVQYA
jgi:hypothetical protein